MVGMSHSSQRASLGQAGHRMMANEGYSRNDRGGGQYGNMPPPNNNSSGPYRSDRSFHQSRYQPYNANDRQGGGHYNQRGTISWYYTVGFNIMQKNIFILTFNKSWNSQRPLILLHYCLKRKLEAVVFVCVMTSSDLLISADFQVNSKLHACGQKRDLGLFLRSTTSGPYHTYLFSKCIVMMVRI